MHSEAQLSLNHISTLGKRRLGQLLAALRWDANPFCGGADGSFVAGNFAEHAREGYVGTVVEVLSADQTRLKVRVFPAANSAFHPEPSELVPIARMQQRILAELQQPGCDEVRLELEAAQVLALMVESSRKPAPSHDKTADSEPTAEHSRSRSRSPPEQHQQPPAEARDKHRNPKLAGVPDKVIRTKTKTEVFYSGRRSSKSQRESHARVDSHRESHVPSPQPQPQPPSGDPETITVSSSPPKQPVYVIDSAGSSTAEKLGFVRERVRRTDKLEETAARWKDTFADFFERHVRPQRPHLDLADASERIRYDLAQNAPAILYQQLHGLHLGQHDPL